MRDLPSGTVTFLFTDIEGSTRLLHEHGEAYVALLAEHRRESARDLHAPRRRRGRYPGRRVLRGLRSGGRRSRGGRGRSGHVDGPVRVRIGIHTGTPTLTPRATSASTSTERRRICAAAHGGQVVLSEATRAALGRRAGPRPRAPPAQGPRRARTPLPARLGDRSRRCGRSTRRTCRPRPVRSSAGARSCSRSPRSIDDARVVTITGAGGSGKTRLALQAAADSVERFGGGVVLGPAGRRQRPHPYRADDRPGRRRPSRPRRPHRREDGC